MAETDYSAILVAPAKLNLSLTIRSRRPDGLHDLISLVCFLDLHDTLSISLSETEADHISVTGCFAAGLDGDNLVLRAISAFRDAVGYVPPLSITLHKAIPVAAGLGGGSADAAAILRLLAKAHGRSATTSSIHAIAARLGADIPVCLASRCRYVHGTGTNLDPEETGFSTYPVLLVNPGISVPTGSVFRASATKPKSGREYSGSQSLAEDMFAGRNDLETPAIAVAPEIGPVLAALSDLPGTIGPRLSGSGATCFALFETEGERDLAERQIRQHYPEYWIYAGKLKNWDLNSLLPETEAPLD